MLISLSSWEHSTAPPCGQEIVFGFMECDQKWCVRQTTLALTHLPQALPHFPPSLANCASDNYGDLKARCCGDGTAPIRLRPWIILGIVTLSPVASHDWAGNKLLCCMPCHVWPACFHNLIHPNQCWCRKIELHFLDIWVYSFNFIPNKRTILEGLWKITSEGKNKGATPWLTLTLACKMLFLFPPWPWISAQIILVCGIMLHITGVSGNGIMLACPLC